MSLRLLEPAERELDEAIAYYKALLPTVTSWHAA